MAVVSSTSSTVMNNVEAVRATLYEAMKSDDRTLILGEDVGARGGGGPTLVEGCCYRYLAHSTDDNDMTYRTREDVMQRRKQDPVPAFEALLLERGIMKADQVSAMRKDVLRETNEATDAAEALPYPAAADLYTHVYEGAWQPWQS